MMNTALIALDLINDIVDGSGQLGANSTARQVKSRGIMERTNAALAIARRKAWPVVLVKVGFSSQYQEQPKHSPLFGHAHEFNALELGQWGTEFHSELRTAATDFILTKTRVSAFYNTPLESLLRAQRIERVVLLGVSTTWAVESTARDAHDRDYRVVVAEDACASRDEEQHRASIKNLSVIASVMRVDQLETV
jgi:biuret amidohydrolase